ncbi:MarR family transcriptional regulator [Rhodopseudomonas sp. P2A-2r]|uniref:MarR family transcriptional regulator n=1 Tax=Rhodopseudomonas sp. P2A-2r TaxID=2991972 RepID=UPI0022344B39|nr:helix-turn-helix domain-containing protein [Rhodopseudomonas sp. P2A-2r]UZE51112.1 MarR family transcriptional regulator [Rhodopseudomonas sp. P2A-2r]
MVGLKMRVDHVDGETPEVDPTVAEPQRGVADLPVDLGAAGGALNSPMLLMATVSEIANRDGISKQAVSKKVKALIDLGLAVERNERGDVGRVNVAQYDFLRGKHDDPSKNQRPGAQTQQPPARDMESYEEALRKKTWYEAERKGLELAEQRGDLVRVADLAAATGDCGEEIVAVLRRLSDEADALAAAVTRDGVHGMRVALKAIENRMMVEVADKLAALARLGKTPQPAPAVPPPEPVSYETN